MKKSQIGQIFIYVLTLVIISFILIYGYNAIKNFKEKSEQISLVKFKNELSNIVEIISPDYGSVKIRNIEVPSGYDEVCFVEYYKGNFPLINTPSLFDNHPILKDSVNSGVKKNVFLIREITEKSFFIGDIKVISDDNKILCFKVANNIIKIKFEGRGDHALLSKT